MPMLLHTAQHKIEGKYGEKHQRKRLVGRLEITRLNASTALTLCRHLISQGTFPSGYDVLLLLPELLFIAVCLINSCCTPDVTVLQWQVITPLQRSNPRWF
ncbi:hypothetical protein Y1Q_0022593 [Alligator mississippiensis]|uniref:Uncharacterized protein n=1 Tax=Alligator mississippiensis TaxID=8496 RepID=A0A151NQG3_ALLMI|nr:hypothetical protein Y1Q_0022593 [Alligator mississippiensis]